MRLARGAFWSLAGAAVSKGLTLASMIVAARLLGREGFGEFGMVQSTVTMFSTLAAFGLGLTATKHVAALRSSDPVRAGRVVGLSSLVALATGGGLALVVWFFAPWLAERTLAAPHLAPALQLGAPILIFGALNGSQLGALAGFEAFRGLAKASLVAGLGAFPLIAGGVWVGGLRGAVGGLLASQVLNWAVHHVALRVVARRDSVPLGLRGSLSEWRILWGFSLPAALSGAMIAPVTWACNAMLANRPDGYAEMGLFNAANQWALSLVVFSTMLAKPYLPILSSVAARGGEPRAFNKALLMMVLMTAVPVCLLGGTIALFADIVMSGYGEAFREGGNILRLLVGCAAAMALTAVGGRALASLGRLWMSFACNGVWALLVLGLTAALVSRGATGLAEARFLGYLVHGLLVVAAVWILLRLPAASLAVERVRTDAE